MAFVRLQFDVKGIPEFEDALEKYGERATEAVMDVLMGNAKIIAEKAKGRVPVGKTGQLKRSIRYGKAKNQGPMAVRVYTSKYYAPYQEFGTGAPARGYVPTLPTELQRLAARYRGMGLGFNPNITPKKFLWNAVIDQQPVIIPSIKKRLELLSKF